MPSSDLQPLLQDIANYLAELQLTLLNEYEAFAHGDAKAVQQAGNTEIRLCEILDDLKIEQSNLLEHAGLNQSYTGMKAYLELQTKTNQQTMVRLWQRILKLEQNCQRLDKINSLIIKKHRYQVDPPERLPQSPFSNTTTQSARITTVYDPSTTFRATA